MLFKVFSFPDSRGKSRTGCQVWQQGRRGRVSQPRSVQRRPPDHRGSRRWKGTSASWTSSFEAASSAGLPSPQPVSLACASLPASPDRIEEPDSTPNRCAEWQSSMAQRDRVLQGEDEFVADSAKVSVPFWHTKQVKYKFGGCKYHGTSLQPHITQTGTSRGVIKLR